MRTIAETGTSSRPESERGDRETHKFQWDCATGIAYLNGTAPGWRVTRVLQAFDVSNPDAPRHLRDFGLPGYEPTARGMRTARPYITTLATVRHAADLALLARNVRLRL